MAERVPSTPHTWAFRERAAAELFILNSKLHDRLKQDIAREVYNRNVLRHKEDAVVAQIRKAGCGLEPVTPDSEVFVTPKEGSPLEAPSVQNQCGHHGPYLWEKTAQSLYYSLVHIEDDLRPHASQQFSFDRELAEQDLLSHSFRSIILKEERLRKPITFDFRNFEGKKGPVKVLNTIEANVEIINRCKLEEEMSMGESLMEAISSGYATGSSQRGTDTTEIVLTDDIPQDKSAASSSVSSDPGTWDDQQTFVEKEIPIVPLEKQQGSSIAATCFSTDEFADNHSIRVASVSASSQQMENERTCYNEREQLDNKESSACPLKGNFFIDASTLRDEDELLFNSTSTTLNSAAATTSTSTNTKVITTFENVDFICNSDNSITGFIEENENNISVGNKGEEETRYDCPTGDMGHFNCDVGIRKTIGGISKVHKEDEALAPTGTDSVPIQDGMAEQADIPVNIPILTRRNTFELELNEEQTARLKQEYEKANGLEEFNDSNIGRDSDAATRERNEKNKSFSSVQNETSLMTGAVIDGARSNPEESHSPDSLNNDFPYESFVVEAKEEEIINEMTLIIDSSFGKGHTNEVLRSSSTHHPIDNTKESWASPSKVSTVSESHQQLNCSAVSDLSNSSGPNSSLSASCLSSSKREAESTDDTTTSPKPSEKIGETTATAFTLYSENRIESRPILSGMSDLSDYSLSASPVMSRRKNMENDAPILSGGYDGAPPEPSQIFKKPKVRTSNSMNTSWVVDMSVSGRSPPSDVAPLQERYTKTSTGMGFFVPLDDPYPSMDSVTSNSSERSERKYATSERNSSSSCGFYIDLKNDFESNGSDCESVGKHPVTKEETNNVQAQEKKLFPLFIDIGSNNGKDTPRSKPGSPFLTSRRKVPSVVDRMSIKNLDKKSTSTSSDSGLDCAEHIEHNRVKSKTILDTSLEQSNSLITSDCSTNDSACSTKRQSFFMFIEANESPVIRRKTLPSAMRHSANRHSWNNEKKFALENHVPSFKEHKRSSSVSVCDESLPKVDADKSGPVSIDEITGIKKEKRKMQSSWHGGQVKASTELSRIIANGAKHEYDRARGQRKSIDYAEDPAEKVEELSSSLKSDDMCDVSNATSSKEDRTFIMDDVSKAVNFSSNELELSTPSHDIISDLSKDNTETDPALLESKSTSSNATNKSTASNDNDNDLTPKLSECSSSQPALVIQEDEEDIQTASFVKLSDMDREPIKTITSITSSAWSTVNVDTKTSRMSRSIPEVSWLETKLLANSASSRSLSRLFPHLYPQKTQESDADQSPQSSMQSSLLDPSPMELSTEGSVSSSGGGTGGHGNGAPCSRLGEDLLRMFLDEISPDVTVDVGGRRIRAHKCILSSRCQYFAGMLSGGWVESAGNVISLQGFSYSAVHFALCHIYSGASNIPDTINIVELATLADMLCLEGLKEVIMYTLKVKYCHFFHKPCSGCTVGVLECLPLAAAYGLDEIYRKSLRWITRHFVRVWPTKEFAALPKELQEKCYRQHVVNMNIDNVLQTILGCESLEATVPNVRRAQSVLALSNKLHELSVKYLTQHFSSVITSDAFMTIGKEDAWTVTRLEETLLSSSRNLSPDQSCQAYKKLKGLVANINATCQETCEMEWKVEFIDLLGQLEASVEDCLVRQAGRAARTTSWAQMDLALRRKIQEVACLVFTPGPRQASSSSTIKKQSESKAIRGNESNIKSRPMSNSNAAKRTSSVSATGCIQQSRPQSASNQLTSSLPKPKVNTKLAQVKSRYMDPRPVRKESTEAQQVTLNTTIKSTSSLPRRPSSSAKAVSSSDSSRTSSPATNNRAMIRPRSTNSGGRENIKSGPDRGNTLPGRSETRVKSSESIADGSVNKVSRPRAAARLDGTKSSPTLPSKRHSHGGSPSLGKSPATNSSASPSLGHRVPPPTDAGTTTTTGKPHLTLKRNSTTFKVATKTTKASTAKQTVPRDNVQRIITRNSLQQPSTITAHRPRLTVTNSAPRSSTFSKDETSSSSGHKRI